MDLFKDPKLQADNFNADTDNYSFAVLAWKSLTRVHPFGGTAQPDISIMERMKREISVIDRPEIKLPRTTKKWSGFSPDLVAEFKNIFEGGLRTLADNLEDMQKNLLYCSKDKEYYYGKFSSCPYCDSNACVNIEPVSRGIINGLKLYAVYSQDKIKAVLDRHTYISHGNLVVNTANTAIYQTGVRYYFDRNGNLIEDMNGHFILHSHKEYKFEKKYKSAIEVCGNKIYYISAKNTLTQLEIMTGGNGIKSICKVSNTAYFAVNKDNYCVVNYYTGKIIVNVNGTNTVIDYDYDIVNYGIHRDEISGKWLIILEDSKGKFITCLINNGKIEYKTDSIKYTCQLNCPCIYNSNIFIPSDGKIRGYSYRKSAFRDFKCSVISEESKLIKEKNRFVIVNLENVYYLEG